MSNSLFTTIRHVFICCHNKENKIDDDIYTSEFKLAPEFTKILLKICDSGNISIKIKAPTCKIQKCKTCNYKNEYLNAYLEKIKYIKVDLIPEKLQDILTFVKSTGFEFEVLKAIVDTKIFSIHSDWEQRIQYALGYDVYQEILTLID